MSCVCFERTTTNIPDDVHSLVGCTDEDQSLNDEGVWWLVLMEVMDGDC